MRNLATLALALCVAGVAPAALAQPADVFAVRNGQLQKRANGVLALMGYSVVPDLTMSSLSIQSADSGNPSVAMAQVAGGFTVSPSTPLYLEGGAAASRYDPVFVASNGQDTRQVPVKWNNLALTGGIGWDFPVVQDLKFRPIFNISLGRVVSDLAFVQAKIQNATGDELSFLDGGHLDAYGIGGSVMLDYERYRPDNEVDVELRYTNIQLTSFGNTSRAVQGRAEAIAASIWARYRAPTGFIALDRPVRYVLEAAHTHYYGDQAGVLGFTQRSSIGAGLELDSSAHDVFITRTRLMLRYMFGNDVSGFAVGLAVSF